jgi:predicted dehydrogenase
VEKPVTPTGAAYRELREHAGRRNRILCGDYSTLGMPVVVQALEMIRSGAFGRPVAVHCTFAGSEGGGMIQYKDPAHWAYRLRGGILQNMLDHPLSLILSVLDPVTDHDVRVSRRNMLPFDCPDLMQLTVGNEDQVGSITLALGHGANERRALFILEGGSIVIDMGRQLISSVRGRGPQNFVKKALNGITEGWAYSGGTVANIWQGVRGKLARDPGIAAVMRNFYDAFERGQPLMVDPDMLLRLTALLDGIWEDVDYRAVPGEREVAS